MDEMRNKRISSKRRPVERFYAFIKCVCKAEHVAVTAIPMVRVKMIITGIVFNAYHFASAKGKLQA
jgi:IS5 family transposase